MRKYKRHSRTFTEDVRSRCTTSSTTWPALSPRLSCSFSSPLQCAGFWSAPGSQISDSPSCSAWECELQECVRPCRRATEGPLLTWLRSWVPDAGERCHCVNPERVGYSRISFIDKLIGLDQDREVGQHERCQTEPPPRSPSRRR